jgi:DNA invertase Pin-like site-specific DNA recombinase
MKMARGKSPDTCSTNPNENPRTITALGLDQPTVKAFTDRCVTLVSVSDGIDRSTRAGRMTIGVLGSLAEYEWELTNERTALKRAISRANGTKFGRPRKVANAEHASTAKRMNMDGHTGKAIAKYLGVSGATAYRYLAGDAD